MGSGGVDGEVAPTPFRWGSERGLALLFPHGLDSLTVTRRTFYACHRSPEAFWDFLTETNWFIAACLDRVDPTTREAIHDELMTLLTSFNHADDGTVVLAQGYTQAVAVRA